MALQLMFVTNRVDVAEAAQSAGVDRIFVDMEYIGKSARQGGMDTVQNMHTIDDVKASMSSVLHDGETVRFTTPKAGDKGSSAFVNVELRNVNKKTVTDVVKIVSAGSSLKDLVDSYEDRVEGNIRVLAIDGEKLSANELVYNASLPLYKFIEGASYTVILLVEESATGCDGTCNHCNSCKEDYTEHEDPDYCEDEDYEDEFYEDEYEAGDELEEAADEEVVAENNEEVVETVETEEAPATEFDSLAREENPVVETPVEEPVVEEVVETPVEEVVETPVEEVVETPVVEEPVVEAPVVAPQTFDAAVIAVLAVVTALGGAVVSKKRH